MAVAGPHQGRKFSYWLFHLISDSLDVNTGCVCVCERERERVCVYAHSHISLQPHGMLAGRFLGS